jgi:hypothetical protein
LTINTLLFAETLYIDSRNGNDANTGAKEQPLKTLARAAELVNASTEAGPTIIKLAPGLYDLSAKVLLQNTRAYSREQRLIIEAAIMPDDPAWRPALMPVIISTEQPAKLDSANVRGPATFGLQIEISHVTIRGLKFLGSAAAHNRYYPIRRNGQTLEDLVVSQCVFVGDRHTSPIQVAVIAHGHGLVLEHCVFYECKNPVVFWEAEGGTSTGNAMRYCLVSGGYQSGVWLVDTGEDFDFHHNVIIDSHFFLIREASNRRTYRLRDCIIANNRNYAGYGSAGGPLTPSGSEAPLQESNIVKTGNVQIELDTPRPAELSWHMPKYYLHIVPGTFGSELGAGLFAR